jgi:hypothetical protein
VVETVPDGADVVFMFGEIDCRRVAAAAAAAAAAASASCCWQAYFVMLFVAEMVLSGEWKGQRTRIWKRVCWRLRACEMRHASCFILVA